MSGTSYFITGWAEAIFPYVKSTGIYQCPDDATPLSVAGVTGTAIDSYGMNDNFLVRVQQDGLTGTGSATDSAITQAALNAPASTVLLFEVANIKGFYLPPVVGSPRSAESAGGYDDLCGTAVCSYSNQGYYATGSGMSGAAPGTSQEVNTAQGSDTVFMTGRHTDGSNFLAADGHVKWLLPQMVSGGRYAKSATAVGCAYSGCAASSGTSVMMTRPNNGGSALIPVTLTFSPN